MRYTIDLDPNKVHALVAPAVLAGNRIVGVKLVKDAYGIGLKQALGLYDMAARHIRRSMSVQFADIAAIVTDEGYQALNDTQAKIFNAALEAREEAIAERREERGR